MYKLTLHHKTGGGYLFICLIPIVPKAVIPTPGVSSKHLKDANQESTLQKLVYLPLHMKLAKSTMDWSFSVFFFPKFWKKFLKISIPLRLLRNYISYILSEI